MTDYNELFGGETISPAQLSYASYEIDENLALAWPFNADPDADVAADKIDIDATAADLVVTLPSALAVSVGQDVLFNNVGVETFFVNDNSGTEIAEIAPGELWYIYLRDNSTAAGSWAVTQFASTVSTAVAAQLAGAGLRATTSLLDQNLPTTSIAASYAPCVGDRATMLLYTGGVGTLSPTSAATLGDGWFVYVVNAGSGVLTWTPPGAETVDGEATKAINPDESAIFFSDGDNFWTVGYGRAITSTVTATAINLAAETSPLTLSAAQVAAQVQDYSGLLTGNFIVNYGTGVGYWFVRNNTSGAFTLTLRVNGSDSGVAIAQGSYSIVRSNGSNLTVAFTATSGTVTNVATGTGLTGGPITTTGTISLANTAVVAGTYGGGLNVPNIAIDAQGRITSASNVALGSAAALTAGSAVGNVPVLNASALVPPENGGASTGDIKFNVGTAITGWVLSQGTIGNAASGATRRADADTVNLFTLLWNSWADAQAPVSGGRGANAAADYAANKTITLPDLRGRSLFGMDVLGGSASAARLSTYISSSTPGASGGTQSDSASVTVSSVTVSGVITVSSGAVPVTGTISNASSNAAAGVSQPGLAQVGDQISGSTSIITCNGANAMTGTGSGTTATVSNLPPLMVMNVFIKL